MLRKLFGHTSIIQHQFSHVRGAAQQAGNIALDIKQKRASAMLGGGQKRIDAQHKKVSDAALFAGLSRSFTAVVNAFR